MPEPNKVDFNKGGRIVLDKDGKLIAVHQIDPHNTPASGIDAATRQAAHGYERGQGKRFKNLTPEEVEARRVKPVAPATAAASTAADTTAANEGGKK